MLVTGYRIYEGRIFSSIQYRLAYATELIFPQLVGSRWSFARLQPFPEAGAV